MMLNFKTEANELVEMAKGTKNPEFDKALSCAPERLKNEWAILKLLGRYPSAIKYAPEESQNDKAFMLAAIMENSDVAAYVPEGLFADGEFAAEALQYSILAYNRIPDTLLTEMEKEDGFAAKVAASFMQYKKTLYENVFSEMPDRFFTGKIITELVKKEPRIWEKYLACGRATEEVVMELVDGGCRLDCIPTGLEDNRRVVLKHLKYSCMCNDYEHIDKELLNDREFMLAAVKIESGILGYASEDLRNDREVVLAAVTNKGYALQYASEELRNDKEVVLAAVTNEGYALQYASKELYNDRAFMLGAIGQIGMQYCPEELGSDKAFVLAAIGQIGKITFRGDKLKYASEELHNDREVVLAAVTNDGYALKYASDKLRNDREVVLAAVTNDGLALDYASEELRNDREVVLAAVTNDGLALDYASEELRNDREVVLAAVTNDGGALEYASEELRNDREVVLAALMNDGCALRYASKELRADKTVVLTAICSKTIPLWYFPLKYASEDLKGDREVVLKAVRKLGNAIEYASAELQADEEIQRIAKEHWRELKKGDIQDIDSNE